MAKKLFFIWCYSLLVFPAMAQTSRPGVLVVGNGNAAAAAAIQSAVSGVKTTLLLQAGGFDIDPLTTDLHSGIQAEFINRLRLMKGENDNPAIPAFDKQTASEVLSKWTDTLKNLTVIRNTPYTKADRAGNNWIFKLYDGKTIRASVLILAGDGQLLQRLKINTPVAIPETALDYTQTLYRTSVASGKQLHGGGTASVFSLYSLLIGNQENLIWLPPQEGMLIGQAAGATAAYAAFFGKKTSQSNLKTIQGELLNYKLALMPFADIGQNDPNWKAIQFVGLTGVIKADVKDGIATFLPDNSISLAEIKQPLKDFYYKAQLWFDDHQETDLSLKLAIDLVSYVGNKSPESVTRELEKKWKTTYKLNSDFLLEKIVTRREFALLLQDYLPPFHVNVDKTGLVVR